MAFFALAESSLPANVLAGSVGERGEGALRSAILGFAP